VKPTIETGFPSTVMTAPAAPFTSAGWTIRDGSAKSSA
jgi:hypothetical protein